MKPKSKKQCLQNAEQLLTSQIRKIKGGKGSGFDSSISDSECGNCKAGCQTCSPGHA